MLLSLAKTVSRSGTACLLQVLAILSGRSRFLTLESNGGGAVRLDKMSDRVSVQLGHSGRHVYTHNQKPQTNADLTKCRR